VIRNNGLLPGFKNNNDDDELLTSRKILFNLTTNLPLHERRFSERGIRRHAPVPDLRRRQRFVERVGFVVEAWDRLGVCGRDDFAAAGLVRVRGTWRGLFAWICASGSGSGWC
jgi:hypothetical protein